jgi:radical SAM superfamily enzyme YgiQ (UPF0313 family)
VERLSDTDRRAGPAIGLSYIASFLRHHGVHVDILDHNLRLSEPDALGVQLAKGYDIVGISLFSVNTSVSVSIERIDRIKQLLPESLVVVGGLHATLMHESILRDHPSVDIAVRGEGEHTMLEIVQFAAGNRELDSIPGISFRNEAGSIVVNPARPLLNSEDLSSLPFPETDTLREYLAYNGNDLAQRLFVREATVPIIASRGCPHNCTFCSVARFYRNSPGHAWRARSVDSLLGEMRELQLSLGIKKFRFVDDSFLSGPKWVEQFVNALEEEDGVDYQFTLNARADDILRNKDLIPRLRRVGCDTIEIGLESGAQSTLDRYQKGTTVQQNVEAVHIVQDAGCLCLPDIIMFDPWTTTDELAATVLFLKDTHLWGKGSVFYLRSTLAAYPCTAIYDRITDEDLVDVNSDPRKWRFIHSETVAVWSAIQEHFDNNALTLERITSSVQDVIKLLADLDATHVRHPLIPSLKMDAASLWMATHQFTCNLFESLVAAPGNCEKLVTGANQTVKEKEHQAQHLAETVHRIAAEVSQGSE